MRSPRSHHRPPRSKRQDAQTQAGPRGPLPKAERELASLGLARRHRGHSSRTALLGALCLGLLSCDALFAVNAKNCVENTRACAGDQVCNLQTQACEARSCRNSEFECLADQFCDPDTKLCVIYDCVALPNQCAADQRCNQETRLCETVPFVLGQPDLTSNYSVARGLRSPQGVLLVPDLANPSQSKLLIADRGNRRVLIWNRVPTQNVPADVVLGMPDVNTLSPDDAYGGLNEASFLSPATLSSDGTSLAVADSAANRVLFWNRIPTTPSTKGPIPANTLWGQSNFGSSLSDSPGGSTNKLGVASPSASFGGGGRFYIPDQFNHRVLAFALAPTSQTTSPSTVYGQLDFTQGLLLAPSATSLREPRQAARSQNELFVADSLNHRVMVFDAVSSTNNPTALAVIGQATFTDGLMNRGGGTFLPAAGSLSGPTALHAMDTPARLLWIADTNNQRVLRYTLPNPTVNNLAADLVLGQPDFTSRFILGTPTAATLAAPSSVHSDGTRLVVSDTNNNRVLLWNSLPTSNQQAADVVIGQPDAVSNAVNHPLPPLPLQFRQVSSVVTDGTRLFVADTGNHRVLIWNQLPKQMASPPDVVLGQTSFTVGLANRGGAGPNNASMDTPIGIAVEGGRLAVADSGNNRVLVWDALPTQNGAAASRCIGQPSCSQRVGGTTQVRLQGPNGVSLVAGRLYVADTGNHRVVWIAANSSTGIFEGMLGQQSFTAKEANSGGQSAATMSSPRQVLATPTQVLVADSGNHRVLLWNTLPTSLGQAADVVLGQDDFASSYTRVTRSRLENPSALLLRGGSLYVASAAQDRILIWSQLPSTNGQPADLVIGQPDFTSSLPNHPELPPESRLSGPVGLAAAGNQLFIAEQNNNRILVRDLAP